MATYEVLGWIGTILTAVYLIPQVFKVFKTRNAKDISYYSVCFLIIASTIWIVYGFITPQPQPQIYVTNIFQALFSGVILVYKIFSKKNNSN